VKTKSAISDCRGLTVLEMLVSVTLLVFIVVGLTAMFIQTQRAFKSGVKQTAMTDAGHTIIDMVGADVSQVSDAQNTNIHNLYWAWAAANTSVNYQDNPAYVYRTNQLQEIFALIYTNTQWVAVGYAVSNYASGAGTLYRFVTNTPAPLTTNAFLTIFNHFQSAVPGVATFDPAYFHPVADGVVHLKMRAFDQYGNESWFSQGQDFAPSGTFSYPVQAYTNNLLLVAPPAGLPSAIQLEVGVLEPDALQQLRALPTNSVAQKTFIGNAGGKIQIYRQNIPVAGATR
jgi:Tfp pilus assembly protein PilV